MIHSLKRWPMLAVLLLLALVACGPPADESLPTLIDLGAISTADAATAAALATSNAPTLTPTSGAPTLPPTFTPTLPPSATPTDPALAPTATPEGYSASGTIYYIYNSDSIAELTGDGQFDDLLLRGGPFSDLTASPDGQLLTYVAPGVGGGREVWVSSRDGAYSQQVSCLHYADVRSPAWSPDGRYIAFFAAPSASGPYDLFRAAFAGSSTCPTGNDQRLIAPVSSPQANSIAWSLDGTKIFYAAGPVSVVDLSGGTITALTSPSGFGSDFSLSHHPAIEKLAYLRVRKDLQTGQQGGSLIILDTSIIVPQLNDAGGVPFYATGAHFGPDAAIAVSAADAIYIYDTDYGSSTQLLGGLAFSPETAFNPSGDTVAYTGAGTDNPAVAQIFIVPRAGGQPQQLTNHSDGIISDPIWLPG